MSDSIMSYFVRLDEALRKGEPFTSPNTDFFHASAIAACVFKYAKNKIRLLSSSFDERLYCNDHKVGLLDNFIGNGGELEILVEQELRSGHRIWELVRKHGGKLTVKLVPEQERLPSNFLIADQFGFRHEKDKSVRKALVCFNEPLAHGTLIKLTRTFDALVENAIPLSPA